MWAAVFCIDVMEFEKACASRISKKAHIQPPSSKHQAVPHRPSLWQTTTFRVVLRSLIGSIEI